MKLSAGGPIWMPLRKRKRELASSEDITRFSLNLGILDSAKKAESWRASTRTPGSFALGKCSDSAGWLAGRLRTEPHRFEWRLSGLSDGAIETAWSASGR